MIWSVYELHDMTHKPDPQRVAAATKEQQQQPEPSHNAVVILLKSSFIQKNK